jgi:hypothetical protein
MEVRGQGMKVSSLLCCHVWQQVLLPIEVSLQPRHPLLIRDQIGHTRADPKNLVTIFEAFILKQIEILSN